MLKKKECFKKRIPIVLNLQRNNCLQKWLQDTINHFQEWKTKKFLRFVWIIFSFNSLLILTLSHQTFDQNCDLRDPYFKATLDNTFPAFHPRSSVMLFFSRLNTIIHEYQESTEPKEVVFGVRLVVSISVSNITVSKNMPITKSAILFLFLVHSSK